MKYTLLSLLLFAASVMAAEDFTLWDSATFNAPFTDGVVAVSSPITNNAGLNGIKIVIDYETISPKPCNCQLTAVIEEEIATGVWSTLAAQHQVISSDDNAPTRILVASPHFNANPGTDEYIAVGEGVRISSTDARAPDKFRVVIYNTDTGATDLLSSVTITANGRKFDQ